MNNYSVKLEFDALPENESFARVTAAAFVSRLDPTMEEISDIKTAVSEAVTNSIIHGYDNKGGVITMSMFINEDVFRVTITDYGKGIDDIQKAMEPMYTSATDEERSGMGFVFMEAFMDSLTVDSVPQKGTSVHMEKNIGSINEVPVRGE